MTTETTETTTEEVTQTTEATQTTETKETATETPAGKTTEQTVEQKWPDDWRTLAAGEDDKMQALAKRYNSPADVLKALRAAQVRISSGELKAALPKDATPEQVAEWRKENGIPEDPSKYDLGVDDKALSDSDKALVTEWVKSVHGANAHPEVVKAGVSAFLQAKEVATQQAQEKNEQARELVEDELRAEWGSDYKTNVAGIKSMLGQADSAVADAILSARGADGIAILNKPEVVRWLASHARELGYVGATVVPAGGDPAKSIADELDGLKAEMRKDIDAWRKNTKGQARFQELVAMQQRMNSRK